MTLSLPFIYLDGIFIFVAVWVGSFLVTSAGAFLNVWDWRVPLKALGICALVAFAAVTASWIAGLFAGT